MKKLEILIVVLLFAAAGCGKAPQAEFDAANAALLAAQEGEADLYVSDMFHAAQESLAVAQIEIEAQQAAGRFSREYGRAQSLLAFASTTATQALEAVEVRKEEVRLETEQMMVEADQTLVRVEELLAVAPRGKDGAMALVSIREDHSTASQILTDARTAFDTGDFAQAHDLTRAAIDQANTLIAELESAVSRTTARG